MLCNILMTVLLLYYAYFCVLMMSTNEISLAEK